MIRVRHDGYQVCVFTGVGADFGSVLAMGRAALAAAQTDGDIDAACGFNQIVGTFS